MRNQKGDYIKLLLFTFPRDLYVHTETDDQANRQESWKDRTETILDMCVGMVSRVGSHDKTVLRELVVYETTLRVVIFLWPWEMVCIDSNWVTTRTGEQDNYLKRKCAEMVRRKLIQDSVLFNALVASTKPGMLSLKSIFSNISQLTAVPLIEHAGFANSGNTCFMDASLTSLFHTITTSPSTVWGEGGELMETLDSLFKYIQTGENKAFSTVSCVYQVTRGAFPKLRMDSDSYFLCKILSLLNQSSIGTVTRIRDMNLGHEEKKESFLIFHTELQFKEVPFGGFNTQNALQLRARSEENGVPYT